MLIQEVANAMRLRLSTDAITQSIYVHPALSEVLQLAFGSLQLWGGRGAHVKPLRGGAN